MQLITDPYIQPRRSQGHRRLPRYHPEPQGPSYIHNLYIKMTLDNKMLLLMNPNRRQGRRRLPRHPPEPQGHLFCAHLLLEICQYTFAIRTFAFWTFAIGHLPFGHFSFCFIPK